MSSKTILKLPQKKVISTNFSNFVFNRSQFEFERSIRNDRKARMRFEREFHRMNRKFKKIQTNQKLKLMKRFKRSKPVKVAQSHSATSDTSSGGSSKQDHPELSLKHLLLRQTSLRELKPLFRVGSAQNAVDL